jgi:hypothetical protein
VPPGHLPHEFVFASGRRCKTYDDLIKGCQEEWLAGCEMLCEGVFDKFFSSIGRMDLAKLSRDTQVERDVDLALTNFLGGLPATLPRKPKLGLNPHRLMIGKLRGGDVKKVRLTVSNQGLGVLQGTINLIEETVGADRWLSLVNDPDSDQCNVHTSTDQAVLLQLDTRHLPTGRKYAARLNVITNGGVVEVPVRMEVGAAPFPRAPFQGASSPRELAEKMRAQPKAAVALLESGAIAKWFQSNGWNYPVRGPLVRGVAAVQQFFECMGLSRAPKVELTEPEVRMTPVHPEVVRWEVTLITQTKKWVYAQLDTDVPWLKILTPSISGPRQAPFAFEVDSGLLEPNRVYVGQIHITANAGQNLVVNVRVDVQRAKSALAKLFGRS